MRRFKKTTALLGGAAMLMALGTTSATAMRPGGGNGGNDKVAVCHFPPGNPDNAHVIVISENAVPAHEAHGDFVLEDGDTCPPEDGNGGNGGNGDVDADCSVSQENESDNSTGESSQSGLINLNNIGLQGLNLGIGNLLCQADILNGLTAAVLGTAIGGDSGDGGDGGCVASQENESQNSTGGSQQSGLVNLNNVGLQGLNIGVDNLLCQADINGLAAGVLGTAIGGDGDDDGDGDGFLSGLLELDFLDILAGLF